MAGQTTHLHLRHRGIIPSTQLGSGLASASNFLRGDQQWSDRYVHAITSSASNSFIGQVDLRAGANIGLSSASNTITITGTAAGGGGGADHNILSATHLDSLAGSVARGSIIRGNATPKWETLPIAGSAPSNAAFVSDGTDAYWRWPSPVDRITASSSNVLWGQVDFRAGANTALAVSSNTITISSSGGGGGGGSLVGGEELDYVEQTGNTAVTATAEASANTIVTGTAITFDGSTPVMIEFFASDCQCPTNQDDYMIVLLFDGSSAIGQLATMTNSTTSHAARVPIYVARRLTPTNASHTYSVRAIVNARTGNVYAGAAGAGTKVPVFIRITRV